MPQAVLLFSGSLDSMLAARLLLEQGIDVRPLFVRTPWNCGDHNPAAAAALLGLPLLIEQSGEDYFEPLYYLARHADRATKFCGQCHLYLARAARRWMQQATADFVATGDVLGQRAANQKRLDFERYAFHSGLGDRLLWPLSARRLPSTLPEREGWVDRLRLGALAGRSRAGISQWASRLGLPAGDPGRHGCPLGQTGDFGCRVLRQVCNRRGIRSGDIALLRLGRHIRVDDHSWIVLGRRQAENEALERHWKQGDCDATLLARPEDFAGPSALLVGRLTPGALGLAISSVVRYARRPPGSAGFVVTVDRDGNLRRLPCPAPATAGTCGCLPKLEDRPGDAV